SAILLLLKQTWRTSINRFAEAMTLFAVACAGLFPAIHTGRPWLDYWMLPYPNTMGLWPQFRSPLIWDVFAVSTYFTVSLLFWYVGLIPDLTTLRDHSKSRLGRIVYGVLAMGWRGSARHWHRYEMGYFIEAFMAAYSGNRFEKFVQLNRMLGPYWPAYWSLIFCNVLAPQVLWIKRVRQSSVALFCVSLVVLLGMWLERFVIVITSLHRDFLPSSWGMYSPTFWDWATLFGSVGLFLSLLFLFVRFLPMISIAEMRALLP